MIVGKEDISTPADTPHAYATAWRHDAATALVNGSRIHPLLQDDDVFAQIQYLKSIANTDIAECLDRTVAFSSRNIDSLLYVIAKANSVYQGQSGAYTKERIEALLLCPEMTYARIAGEFNLSPEVVRMFERLFFNVRDDEGKLLGCKGFLIYCALKGATTFRPDNNNQIGTDTMYWRVLAFESGYKTLYSIWGFRLSAEEGFNEIDFHVELMRNLFRCLDKTFRFSDRLPIKDIANLVGTLSERFAEMRKSGILSEKDAVSDKRMTLELLQLLVPTRQLEDAKRMLELQTELDSKLTSVKLRERRSEDGTPEAFTRITAQIIKAGETITEGKNNVQRESDVGLEEGGGLS